MKQRRHFILSAALTGLACAVSAPAMAAAKTILIVGDSLSAEYGLARGTGWVALLGERLHAQHLRYDVVNASISGDTTSGGRSRLGSLLAQHKPAVVIIELGGNDALRGLPLSMTQDNLDTMTRTAQDSGAKVLLVGMQIPPNYGADYARRFAEVFTVVAKARHANVVPFLLKGIADDAEPTRWFQADRIHPLASVHPRMLDNVWPGLKPLLK